MPSLSLSGSRDDPPPPPPPNSLPPNLNGEKHIRRGSRRGRRREGRRRPAVVEGDTGRVRRRGYGCPEGVRGCGVDPVEIRTRQTVSWRSTGGVRRTGPPASSSGRMVPLASARAKPCRRVARASHVGLVWRKGKTEEKKRRIATI